MKAGYRALENRQYADAGKTFNEAEAEYGICAYYHLANPNGIHAIVPELANWRAYANAGKAAAEFGEGRITDGLRDAKEAEEGFSVVMGGQSWGEGASANVRRAASDGLAYVRSLASAKKPLLPKVWLDWKAAHP